MILRIIIDVSHLHLHFFFNLFAIFVILFEFLRTIFTDSNTWYMHLLSCMIYH